MSAHPRVAGYLSQALSHEMTVVQQYLTQACLSELWGLGEEAAYFRREAGEELQHAGQIISHMLGLGLVANATHLAPARPGRDLREMLVLDRQLELDAVLLYDEAQHFSQRFRDEASSRLFAALLADEQAHLGELDRMLAALAEKEKRHD
jgi:bacterioferritin